MNNSVVLIITCGDGSVDVKSTEMNIEKGLKIRRFRELKLNFGSRIFLQKPIGLLYIYFDVLKHNHKNQFLCLNNKFQKFY